MLAKKTVLRGKILNEIGLSWDLFLHYANVILLYAHWGTFPHTNSTSVVRVVLSWCPWERVAH